MDTNQIQDLLQSIISGMVSNKEAVQIEKTSDEMGILFTIKVEKADAGKIIGRNGNTASALRTIIRVIGLQNNARVAIRIDMPKDGKSSYSETGSEAPLRQTF